MSKNLYLTMAEYNYHFEYLKSVFDCQQRLPEIVFLTKFTRHYFFEFDSMIAPDFWMILTNLAKHYKNDAIVFAILVPDPVHYYYKEFGHCGAFRLSSERTEDDYFSLLAHEPLGSPADSLLYNSNIVTWAPPGSKSWAIWGEREIGIGVLGASDELGFFHSITQRISHNLAAGIASQNLRLSSSNARLFEAALEQRFV